MTLHTLLPAVSANASHSNRFQTLTELLFLKQREAGLAPYLDDETIECLSMLAPLHDIGKSALPASILEKSDPLTKEEYELMKTHTLEGVRILLSTPDLIENPAICYAYDFCRHHHERWDGSGYPDGLSGSQIFPYTHALGLADVYDALRTDWPYKKAYSHDEAVHLIITGGCGVFQPELLALFIELDKPIRTLYKEELCHERKRKEQPFGNSKYSAHDPWGGTDRQSYFGSGQRSRYGRALRCCNRCRSFIKETHRHDPCRSGYPAHAPGSFRSPASLRHLRRIDQSQLKYKFRQPILNDTPAIIETTNNLAFAINQILGEGIDDVATRIASDFAATSGDNYEIINPYEGMTTCILNMRQVLWTTRRKCSP